MNHKIITLAMGLLVICAVVVGISSDDSDAASVSSYTELYQAVQYSNDVILQNDITLENGQVITIPEGAAVTLELNGKIISVSEDFSGWAVINYGELTITGDGTIDVSASFDGYGSVRNYGTAQIDNGTFTGKTEAGHYASKNGYQIGGQIRNEDSGYLVINDGTFKGTPRALHNLGTAYVNGGYFYGESCSSCTFYGKGNEEIKRYYSFSIGNNSANSFMVFNNGTVEGIQGGISGAYGYIEINGGNFSTARCDNGHQPFHACYIAGDSGEVAGLITGGNFYSSDRYALWVGNNLEGDGGESENASVTVTGGVYKTGSTTNSPILVDVGVGVATIAGGSFFNSASSADAPGTVCTFINLRGGSAPTTDICSYFPEDTEVTIDTETGLVTHEHIMSDSYQWEDNQHWHVCKYCDEPVGSYESHVYGEETLMDFDGVTYSVSECQYCGHFSFEIYVPPVIPGWDDDDEYVPPIVPVQPQDSGDDSVTVVACAAAAVVAALMAAFLILDRKR